MADPTDIPTKASDIVVGMALDLYGDRYADPDKDPGLGYEFEYEEVLEISRAYPGWTQIGTMTGITLVPNDHVIPRKA